MPKPPTNGAKRRPRGAQPGNTNAVKHGLYAAGMWEHVMKGADARLLDLARKLPEHNLEGDIAALRAIIASVYQMLQPEDKPAPPGAKHQPGEPAQVAPLAVVQHLFQGWSQLARLAIVHYRLTDSQGGRLVDGMANVLRELRDTLGDVDDAALLYEEGETA